MKKMKKVKNCSFVKELEARHNDKKEAKKFVQERKERRQWDRTLEKVRKEHPEYLEDLKGGK